MSCAHRSAFECHGCDAQACSQCLTPVTDALEIKSLAWLCEACEVIEDEPHACRPREWDGWCRLCCQHPDAEIHK